MSRFLSFGRNAAKQTIQNFCYGKQSITIISLFAIIVLFGCQKTVMRSHISSVSVSSASSATSSWKEFHNDKFGVRFSVPSEWIVTNGKELPLPKFLGFTLATFESPDTKMRLDEARAHPEIYDGTEGPGSPDLVVELYPDFVRTGQLNSIFFHWTSRGRSYTSLADFFSSQSKVIENVRERSVSGEKAYEAKDWLGFFKFYVAHQGNLFEFAFPIWDETGYWPTAGSLEDKILNSIELY